MSYQPKKNRRYTKRLFLCSHRIRKFIAKIIKCKNPLIHLKYGLKNSNSSTKEHYICF